MVALQTLRRDVLQWLVSLNLSFPIKNIKRTDVSLAINQLPLKEDFPFFHDEIESIINCGSNEGVGPFLERLYGFLTHKRYKPDDVDNNELWRGIPDTNVLFANDISTLSKDDCNFLENAGTIDDFCFRQSKSSDILNYRVSVEGSIVKESGEDDNAMVEMDLQKNELEDLLGGFQESQPSHDELKDKTDIKSSHAVSEKGHNTGTSKSASNAVQRARQKDTTKCKVTSSKARHVSEEVVDNPRGMDVNLAFRSPYRQRKFKTYTLKDYQKQHPGVYIELGRLGPEMTKELLNQRVKLEKMKAFGRIARDINISQSSQMAEGKKTKEKRQSCREKAKEFASNIPKPKRKVPQKENSNTPMQRSAAPMTELEKMEAKHQKDRQKVEAIRRDLECFLR